MYKSICLPLDGVETLDTPAARIADSLTQQLGAHLTGLFVDDAKSVKRRHAQLNDALPKSRRAELADETVDARFSPSDVPFESKLLAGRAHRVLAHELDEAGYELMVINARRKAEPETGGVGPLVSRVLRHAHVDTLVVKNDFSDSDTIVVCMDGSHQAYAGLKSALELAQKYNKRVQAVGVYDPYLHYTLFNGIVGVLTEKASSVFKFQDQEKLHEEIIDTGLAKIYQAHLEVAQKVARDEGVDIELTLLDGKAFERILKLVRHRPPWLLVMGRIGVHSKEGMDIGATTENLLRNAPCNVLISSQTYVPPVDVQAQAAIEWTPDAMTKMDRVPEFVRGVATTAILRWATERGHSVITPSVINSAMGDLLPPAASQAMGYVAEEVAVKLDNMNEGKTFVCPSCGYAIRDVRPPACSVCKLDGAQFEQIDRDVLQKVGKLDSGALDVEETFDGKHLEWSQGAKDVLRRVPSGYQRRRSKARIEKTARVRGLTVLTEEFALDVVQQDLAETSYLTSRGESLSIPIEKDEMPEDATAKAREGSDLLWTDSAWARLCRVPPGFMREMTRERVEGFVRGQDATSIDFELCEQGIAEGRKMMAEMIGAYGRDAATEAILEKISERGAEQKVESKPDVVAKTEGESASAAGKCPVDHAAMDQSAVDQKTQANAASKCPVDHTKTGVEKDKEVAAVMATSGCPFGSGAKEDKKEEPAVAWTPEAEEKLETSTERAVEAGKFSPERAEALARGVAETRATSNRMEEISAAFMQKLGKQLGYGHPLSDRTIEHEFEWTPEANARLQEVPAFCRELTKWRVEWTAVKKDLGNVITPEIMDVKFGMWGEVSENIMQNEGRTMEWAPEAWARVENIPEFVQGQVIQSVEGNAKEWNAAKVDGEVLDKVIQKWIDTGDFHEGQFGYQ